MSMVSASLLPPIVTHIQIDSLVVMKIAKHFESERSTGSSGQVRGYLTGLVAPEDKRLEITNCFPSAKIISGSEEEELKQVQEDQQEMLKKFRQMNIDYQLFGFYECASFGACFTEELVEGLFEYQSTTEDSVVIIFDSVKTMQGLLSIKAYRLSLAAMDRCYSDFTSDSVKKQGLTYETLFEELPLTIKNSHLVNTLLCELGLMHQPEPKLPFLDLGLSGSLEMCLRNLMTQVDHLNQDVNRYNRYVAQKLKVDSIKESALQKRKLENEARAQRGEPPLPLDEVIKNIKTPPPHTMLDPMLYAAQVRAHVDHTLQASGQNLGKLFLAEAIIEEKPIKDRSASSISVSDK